ncbi:MAG: MFS transporter [Oribacterium sp.]|nr:MFS transporter [Oribacterium sp.]
MKQLNRWLYAIAGVMILLFAGLIYAWSVLSGPMAAEYPEWSKGAMSLCFTLAMSFFCIGGLVAGLLAGKVKEKVIFFLSSILFLAGFFLVSNMKTLMQLYLGFGVFAGLGAGFSYNTVMGSVTKWFPDRKGLISGILLMGFGMGAFIIGKLYTALNQTFSWRTEFSALGIMVFLVILLCGMIIRKPNAEEISRYVTASKGTAQKKGNDFTTKQVIADPSFWLFFVYAVLFSAAALALIAQARGIVTDTAPELSAGNIATIVGLISVFNGVGRVIFGGLYDRLGQKMTMILNCGLYFISVLVNLGGLKTGSLPLIILGFILFGLSYGGVPPTNSAFMMDFYGTKHYPVNFSIVNLNLLFASFGGTLAGVIYDRQGSYMTIFMIMMVAVVMAVVCTMMIKKRNLI